MTAFKADKVLALPSGSAIEPDCLYVHRVGDGFDLYCSTANGVLYKLNATLMTSKQVQERLSNYNGLFYNGGFQTQTADNWHVDNVNTFYVTDDFPFGSHGSFSCRGKFVQYLAGDDYISINPYMKYRFSVMARWASKVTAGVSAYGGLASYDVDKNELYAQYVLHMPGTVTTLSQDLSLGDTEVHLTDVSGWATDSRVYRRGFKFYTYRDSTGYLYKGNIMPYSRYVAWDNSNGGWFDDDASSIDATNNKILLNKPWSYANPDSADGAWVAGTELAQSTGAGTYDYIFFGGWQRTQTGATEWEPFSHELEGVMDGTYNINKFRAGTAYVKPIFLLNYSSGATMDDDVRLSGLYVDRL